VKVCNTCGTANADGEAYYCSHCGATLNRNAARPGSSGAVRVLTGIITGVGIAVVYLFIEGLLSFSSGYLLAGRICVGPILALVWNALVLAALIYALVNRVISENLGSNYVTATVITALVVLVLPLAVCTAANFGQIPACRPPMI